MVGEIRDLETAQIAVQAALTGHLVLSTLHTNDAPSARSRGCSTWAWRRSWSLPRSRWSSPSGWCAVVCTGCVHEHALPAAALRAAGWDGTPFVTRQGVGCTTCGGTGFRGRAAVYELLPMGETLHEGLVTGASVLELRRLARAAGMRTLRQTGLALAASGATSVEEILRVTPAD